jgi:glycine C-acetyltransferase
MGSEGLARLVARRLPAIGLLANLVEFPAVPKGQARFRMQVMARHSSRDIIDSVHRLGVATADAQLQLEALQEGKVDFATVDTLSAARRISTPRVRRLTGSDEPQPVAAPRQAAG